MADLGPGFFDIWRQGFYLGHRELFWQRNRRWLRMLRNAVKDLYYARRLLGGNWPASYSGATLIQSTDYSDLKGLAPFFAIQPDDFLVDGGCGRGRVLYWWLARYPGVKITGIEVDSACLRLLRPLAAREPRLTLIQGDVATLLPKETTLLYLFNPFSGDSLERLLNYCETQLLNPEKFRLVYWNALHADRIGCRRKWQIEKFRLRFAGVVARLKK